MKLEGESSDNLLFIVAVVAVAVAVVGTGFTYYAVSSFKQSWSTGYATLSGQVNITITSQVSINFTQNFINITNGSVLEGKDFAIVNTSGGGSVGDGTFTIAPFPQNYMLIENIGNVNVTLNLTSIKNASEFLGGTNPLFQINISNNKTDACGNLSMGTNMTEGSYIVGTFKNITTQQNTFCDRLRYEVSANSVRLDAYLIVPRDSLTGGLTNTIEGTFYQAV